MKSLIKSGDEDSPPVFTARMVKHATSPLLIDEFITYRFRPTWPIFLALRLSTTKSRRATENAHQEGRQQSFRDKVRYVGPLFINSSKIH